MDRSTDRIISRRIDFVNFDIITAFLVGICLFATIIYSQRWETPANDAASKSLSPIPLLRSNTLGRDVRENWRSSVSARAQAFHRSTRINVAQTDQSRNSGLLRVQAAQARGNYHSSLLSDTTSDRGRIIDESRLDELGNSYNLIGYYLAMRGASSRNRTTSQLARQSLLFSNKTLSSSTIQDLSTRCSDESNSSNTSQSTAQNDTNTSAERPASLTSMCIGHNTSEANSFVPVSNSVGRHFLTVLTITKSITSSPFNRPLNPQDDGRLIGALFSLCHSVHWTGDRSPLQLCYPLCSTRTSSFSA